MKMVIWLRCNYTKILPENIRKKLLSLPTAFQLNFNFVAGLIRAPLATTPVQLRGLNWVLAVWILCLYISSHWLQPGGVGGVKNFHIWNCSESASSSHNNWDHWISPNQLAVVSTVGLTWEALSPCPSLALCCSIPLAAWLNVGAGFHRGKPKESHRASWPVSQWCSWRQWKKKS